jgi:hypothetical protein
VNHGSTIFCGFECHYIRDLWGLPVSSSPISSPSSSKAKQGQSMIGQGTAACNQYIIHKILCYLFRHKPIHLVDTS